MGVMATLGVAVKVHTKVVMPAAGVSFKMLDGATEALPLR